MSGMAVSSSITAGRKVNERGFRFQVMEEEEKSSLYSIPFRFEIPIYQRMYSWGEDEIVTMMDDILAFDPSSRYCLGSLIVSSRDHPEGIYEVIDGQQRLTTLVLLKELGKPLPHDFLQFACRPDWEQKAGYQRNLIHDRVEEYTEQWSASTSGDPSRPSFAEEMLSRLRHVDLFCIEVPECTDLNHYFEVMNTRGVHLRQEDILKARLMGALNPEEQESFARDWSACLDFTKMYQPHDDNDDEGDSTGSDQHRYTVKDILDSDGSLWNPSSSGASSAGSLLPISNVPTFLLHVLSVYEEEKGAGSPSLDETLLLSEFSRWEGIQGNHGRTEERFPREFVLAFQKKMKRLRILMDRYLICRERQTGQNGRTVFRFRNRRIRSSRICLQNAGRTASTSRRHFASPMYHRAACTGSQSF